MINQVYLPICLKFIAKRTLNRLIFGVCNLFKLLKLITWGLINTKIYSSIWRTIINFNALILRKHIRTKFRPLIQFCLWHKRCPCSCRLFILNLSFRLNYSRGIFHIQILKCRRLLFLIFFFIEINWFPLRLRRLSIILLLWAASNFWLGQKCKLCYLVMC